MINRFVIFSIELIIRKTKNPKFRFDSGITLAMIISLISNQFTSRLRALKLILRGRLFIGLQMGSGVKLKNLAKVRLGSGIRLGEGVLLDGLGLGELCLGDNSSIGAYSRLIVSTTYSNLGKYISVGSNVAIGEFSYIGGAGGVDIGKDTIAGQYLSIHPENHRFECKDTLIRSQGVARKGVEIGENVWIGSKVTILDGVKVGAGSIICAGAVVTEGNYPPEVLIGGCPAKVIRER